MQCDYIEDYEYRTTLGEGGQASVYLCSKKKDLYAAKVYNCSPSQAKSFKKQVEFFENLHHENLINMVGNKLEARVQLPGKPEMIRPVIFLEFAEGGQLFEFIQKQGKLPAQVCRTFTKMLIKGTEYLHNVGVTHRDLKPENILFDKNFIVKISDFGLSRNAEGDDEDGILYTKLGTEGYKPPEMELGKYTGLQADLFAIGVILFVMYAGSPPFLSTKPGDKVYRLIRQKQFAKFWSMHEKRRAQGFFPDSLKRLLNCFFTAEIDKRPTFETLRDDEWLNGDQAMQNDVYNEMRGRYERILENDENKKKIEKVKLELLQQAMLQEQNQCGEGQGHRHAGGINYIYQINLENLPETAKNPTVATSVKPAVIVSWIEQYIRSCFQSKFTFLHQSLYNIEPVNYNFDFNEQSNKIRLDMLFRLDDGLGEEDSQLQEELSLEGQLIRIAEGKFGVSWQGVSGNAFWLSSVINNLNLQLKILQ